MTTSVACVLLYQVVTTAQWMGLPRPEPIVQRPDRWTLCCELLGYRDASGWLLTWEEAAVRAPMPPEDEDFGAWFTATYAEEVKGTDGARLGFVAWREGAGLGALTLILVGGSAVVVRRRRPT